MLIAHLLRQAKDTEKLFEGEEMKDKNDVIAAMHQKWERQRERERGIEGTVHFI